MKVAVSVGKGVALGSGEDVGGIGVVEGTSTDVDSASGAAPLQATKAKSASSRNVLCRQCLIIPHPM